MAILQTIRHARWLTRLVLVWFALFIGSAIASPMVKPVAGQMVCTTMGGMKLVMDGTDSQTTPATASMDCPLCAHMITPPSPEARAFEPPSALAHALQTLPAARIASLTGAPLPPRGPPALN